MQMKTEHCSSNIERSSVYFMVVHNHLYRIKELTYLDN